MSILLLVVLMGGMYAVLILPQQRKMKRQRELIQSVDVGDDVMTSSGIYGTVTGFDEDDDQIMYLEIAPDVSIRISKGAVAEVAVEADDDDFDDDNADDDKGPEGEPIDLADADLSEADHLPKLTAGDDRSND